MSQEAQTQTQTQTDVKPNPDAASSTTQVQTQVATPPAKENLAQPKESEEGQSIPYPRFKEVNEEKNLYREERNQYKKELDEFRAKVSGLAGKSDATPSLLDEAVSELTKKGMDEEGAKALAEVILSVSQKSAAKQVAPIAEKSYQQEVDGWLEGMEKQYKEEFTGLKDKMFEKFKALPESLQVLTMSDKQGLEMLYGYVKSQNLDKVLDEKYKEGVKNAYENKQLKDGASTSSSGAAVPTGFSREDIRTKGLDWYKQNREAILAAMAEGKLQ